MNLKFLIVLTMVLCALCVLPVNAETISISENPKSYDDSIGTRSFQSHQTGQTSAVFRLNYVTLYGQRDKFKNLVYMSYKSQNQAIESAPNYPTAVLLDKLPANIIGQELPINIGNVGSGTIVFTRLSFMININEWDYEKLDSEAIVHQLPLTIHDIINTPPNNIDTLTDTSWMLPIYTSSSNYQQSGNTDAYIIFGSLNNVPGNMFGKLPETTFISSHQIWNIYLSGTYNTDNGNLYLHIDNSESNYYNISIREINKVNPFYTYAGSDYHKLIDTTVPNKSPIVIRIADIDDNYYLYTYPKNANNQTTGTIQTYDYLSGNMLSGVNLTVYKVLDYGTYLELGNIIYNSRNADSQTLLNVDYSTEYFVQNELEGYVSVKNAHYLSLNNEYGFLWNPTLTNPLRLYYSRIEADAQYNANFIVQDVNNNGISGVSVTMDNSVTKITNSIGGLTFNNISAGTHTFVFVKNGYQTAQQTIDIQLQYAAFYQTMYKDNQIIQPTVSPSAYPTAQPTVSPTLQPTISPIDQPSNLADSLKYGLAKMFGVNSLNTINLIFALLIILFPAVVGAVVTNQALGFISGGLIGFVFALGIGLIPIWVFFSMIMLSVIYLVMTHTEAGF